MKKYSIFHSFLHIDAMHLCFQTTFCFRELSDLVFEIVISFKFLPFIERNLSNRMLFEWSLKKLFVDQLCIYIRCIDTFIFNIRYLLKIKLFYGTVRNNKKLLLYSALYFILWISYFYYKFFVLWIRIEFIFSYIIY